MASEGLQDLSVQLLRVLVDIKKDQNVLYSPLSIMTAFSMLLMGSRNKSAKQLVEALKLHNLKEESIHDEMSKLLLKCTTPLGSYDDSKLLIANGLFIQQNYKIDGKFRSGMVEHYKSEIKELDFNKNAAAAKFVNHWIESKTNNKITDMFTDDSFNSLTRLVLANAIYFKDNFKEAFMEDRTSKKPFHKNAKTHEQIDMMTSQGDYNYAEDNSTGLKMLILPFKNFNFKLLLLLPTKRFGMDDAVLKLSAGTIHGLVHDAKLRIVSKLEVPKFKINSEMDLKTVMSLLGVQDVFNDHVADLSGISDDRLFVDKAVHKTFLDLNENGVEAAAATAMSIALMCAPMIFDDTPIEFVVDEPFLICVYNTAAEAMVFLGKINSP